MIKSYSTVWFKIDCDFLSPSFATERGRDKQLERSTDRPIDTDRGTKRHNDNQRKTERQQKTIWGGGGGKQLIS